MKAAILISGYLRTLLDNLQNIKSKLLDKFDQTDVYLHITNNEKYEDRYLNNSSTTENIEEILKFLKPVTVIRENNFLIRDSNTENNLFNSWFKFYKLNQIRILNEHFNGPYDIVIKYRPDVQILENVEFSALDKDTVYLPEDAKIDRQKLSNPYDKYICDIIAFGSSEVMTKYFDCYTNLDSLVKKHGPISETVLYYYLHYNKINFVPIKFKYKVVLSECNVFAICGDSGTGKSTLAKILKKHFSNSFLLECDRYHKWERGNEHWKSYTHLDPEANYLSKMQEDVFELKLGNSIFQIDYDHTEGKFTDKKQIESADNIIVCGLHSLYIDDSQMYNLKIYMDTDKTLKYKWKILRDTSKRGYTPEQVLRSIESRSEDFEKFVEVQKGSSDVIINFYTDSEFELDNLNVVDDIKLKILIKKNFCIDFIVDRLRKKGVFFSKTEDKDFNILSFERHNKTDLFIHQIIDMPEYYDYILFILLSLKKND